MCLRSRMPTISSAVLPMSFSACGLTSTHSKSSMVSPSSRTAENTTMPSSELLRTLDKRSREV